jgi:hypothetical protein
MKLTLTGRVGSVISDKDIDGWYGTYEVSIFYEATRYKTRINFEGIKDKDDVPMQGDGIAIEFDVENKEITVL